MISRYNIYGASCWRAALWGVVGVLVWAGTCGAAGSSQHVYDSLNRLIAVRYDNGTIQSYTYDDVGNRIDAGLSIDNEAQPDITVSVEGQELLHEAGQYDFGLLALGQSLSVTMTITNTGAQDLLLTGATPVVVLGAQAADFTIVQEPGTTIAPNTSTTFELRFTCGGRGTRQAFLSIVNTDPNETPYTVWLRGDGPPLLAKGNSYLLWSK